MIALVLRLATLILIEKVMLLWTELIYLTVSVVIVKIDVIVHVVVSVLLLRVELRHQVETIVFGFLDVVVIIS